MSESPSWIEFQSGVLPYRRRGDEIEFLLVTSRTHERWIIPKGSLEPDLTPLESARNEAYEEAGVRGTIRSEPLGCYLHRRLVVPSLVQVFLMEVTELLEAWPEGDVRTRQWMRPDKARENVLEDGLRRLMAEALAWIASD